MMGALYHLWTNFDGRALFKCSTVRFIKGKKVLPVFFYIQSRKTFYACYVIWFDLRTKLRHLA